MGVAVHYHTITLATVVKVVASKHLKRILWIFRWEWWLGWIGLTPCRWLWPSSSLCLGGLRGRVRPIPGIHTDTDTRYRYIGIGIGMSKHIGIGIGMNM